MHLSRKHIPFIMFILLFSVIINAKAQHSAAEPDSLNVHARIFPDTLLPDLVTDMNLIRSCSEETVDGLLNIPGFTVLDQGILGQFSSASYLGTGHSNVMPLLNGVPLVSESFGSWNWRDIPFYIIKDMSADMESSLEYPGFFRTVTINTRTKAEDEPLSRINYRTGDYGSNHTDVSLLRKLSSDISFYGAGSTEYFTGKYLDKYENRYRGSNLWFDITNSSKNWDMRLNLLFSDKDNPEADSIVVIQETKIKSMPHSRNIKMASFSFSGKKILKNISANIHYWEMKDRAPAEDIYEDTLSNSEKVFGFSLEGDGYKIGDSAAVFSYRARAAKMTGSYFGSDSFISTHTLSGRLTRRVGEKYIISAAPALYYRNDNVNVNASNSLELLGRASAEMFVSQRFKVSAELARSIRPHSRQIADQADQSRMGVTEIYPARKNEIIDLLSVNLMYKYESANISVKPFFIRQTAPYRFKTLVNMIEYPEEKPGSVVYENGEDLSYVGAVLSWNWYPVNKFSVSGHYTFLSAERSKIYGAKHTLYTRISLRNIEDYITSKRIDTVLDISGVFWSQRSHLLYYPVFEQYSTSALPSKDAGMLKVRGSAIIRSLTFFFETDYMSESDYQQVLGYPFFNVMKRLGVEWNFRN